MKRRDSDSNSKRNRARIAVVVGVAAISFAAIFFRKTAPMHPLVAAGLRLSIAAVCLSPFIVRAWKGMSRSVRIGACVGGLFYAAHFGTWVTSLTLTSVAASVTLVTATPILLATWAFITGTDKPSKLQLGAIAIAVVGVTVIGSQDSGGAIVGDALAFAGAAAMAGYLVIARRQGDDLNPMAFTGLACAVGGALLLLSTVVFEVPLEIPSMESFGFVLLAVAVPQLIGHTAMTYALRVLSPTRVGMATVAEPVGATLLAWLWLTETPPLLTLVGCGITLSAVLLSLRE